MNTTIKNFSKVLLLAITIFSMTIISSCSKDGVDGKNGIDGATGQAGTNGTNGTNSNVNVISTPWTNRIFAGSGSNWGITYPVPAITADIIATGLTLTFKRTEEGVMIQATNTTTPYFWIYYLVGNVEIDATTNQSGFYRNIIIPRAGSSLERGVSKPDYSRISYHEICTKFNIPE